MKFDKNGDPINSMSPSEAAIEYNKLGYQICDWIPKRGADPKSPTKRNWGTPSDPEAVSDHAQIGLLHAQSRTLMVDVDDVLLGTEKLKDLGLDIDNMPGDPPCLTGSGKPKYLYAMPENHSYRVKTYQGMCGEGTILEFRTAAPGSGKQVMDILPPSRHHRGRNYQWKSQLSPWDILPECPQAILDELEEDKANHGGEHTDEPSMSLEEATEALRHIPNDEVNYHLWLRTLLILKFELGDAGLPLFHEWSAKCPAYDSDNTDREWAANNPQRKSGKLLTGATLRMMAKGANPNAYAKLDFEGVAVRGNNPKSRKKSFEAMDPAKFSQRFRPTQEQIESIAKSEFTYKDLIVKGHMIAVVARPGHGKTTVLMHIAKELKGKVLYINADIAGGDMPEAWKSSFDQQGNPLYELLLPNLMPSETMETVVEALNGFVVAGQRLEDVTFIFDTLKKMADLMNKNSAKKLYSLLRSLSALGATIIVLAHSNKWNNQEDSFPVPEGTGDLMSDFDEVLLFYRWRGPGDVQYVSLYTEREGWQWAKTRADIKALTWYFHNSDRNDVKVHESWMDTHAKVQQQHEQELSAPLVSLIVQVFRYPEEELSIKDICDRVNEQHSDISRKVITATLRSQEGQMWTTRTSLHNRQLHKLISKLED
tara:strand:- start:178 stop:2133 length:1956 start_codon:yes stop_codon:yes gene_type:complete